MDISFGSNTSSSSKQDNEPFIDDESSTDEVEVVQHLNSCLKAVRESPLKRPRKITPTYARRKISKNQTVLQKSLTTEGAEIQVKIYPNICIRKHNSSTIQSFWDEAS